MTITALHRLLDEIDAQGGPAAARTNQLQMDAATRSSRIRAWARQAGVGCPTAGRIPARVVAAWQAAQTA